MAKLLPIDLTRGYALFLYLLLIYTVLNSTQPSEATGVYKRRVVRPILTTSRVCHTRRDSPRKIAAHEYSLSIYLILIFDKLIL